MRTGDPVRHNDASGKEAAEFNFDLEKTRVMEFVHSWKDACSSTTDVLREMFAEGLASRKRRSLLQSLPAIELFNVGVTAIKKGWCISDASDASEAQVSERKEAEAPSRRDADEEHKTSGEITKPELLPDSSKLLQEIKNYFHRFFVSEASTKKNKGWSLVLEWLIDCQKRVTTMGCKNLLEFLEQNLELLSDLEAGLFTPSRNVDIPQHRIASFVHQVCNSGGENKEVSHEEISTRLCKQFHLRTIEELGVADVQELVTLSQTSGSTNIYHSAAMLGDREELGTVGKLGSVTSSDAEKCLSRAPMLLDLELWSQWEAIFEPQLGKLLDWLEQSKSITVLVTGGVIIRIDGEAKPEKFLTAVSQGRTRDAASQLVSLVVLHGGPRSAPAALFKSYASAGLKIFSEASYLEEGVELEVGSFVLNCLLEVPHELCEFATEIFYSAFAKLVSADAASRLLQASPSYQHRMLLHRMGVRLGVPEWIDDHRKAGESARELPNDVDDDEPSPKKPRLEISRGSSRVSEDPGVIMDCGASPVERSSTGTTTVIEINKDDEKQESEAREFIEMIRREEFGVDENSGTENEVLAKQHDRIGRALLCLSQKLYTEDCHFILELVQNADDNSYAPETRPTLAFFIQADRVVVLNNEKGFTAKNIRALCDVGNSTKLERSAGYIGHKGIGFKSVFRVTYAPAIHSNGFHVKFDKSESSLGYILPTWVPEPSDDSYFGSILGKVLGVNTFGTRIDLPLCPSENTPTAGQKTISSMFFDLQPNLLLFLHKLEAIVVRDEVSDSFRVMRRHDLENNIVKLSNGENSSMFLVIRQQLEALVDRTGVSSTELALGFELRELSDGLHKSHPQQQEVFSFLPVRSYGLKFIVQGDFILPSSREDVDRDSAWNQWIRSEIPKLFVEALEVFKSSEAFGSKLQALSSYLSYVPVEGEVLGFFSPLPRIILSHLRVVPCLPVEDSEAWTLPCTILRGWNEGFRSLVPDEMLHRLLGLFYLDRRVEISDVLAWSLGVTGFGLETLVSFLKALGDELPGRGMEWLRSYLILMFKSVRDERLVSKHESGLLHSLRVVPFIPLSGGGLSSLDSGPVWFLDTAEARKDRFLELYSDIRTVDPSLIGERAEEARMIREILIRVGVKVATPHDIIKNHILPAMASPQCLERDPKMVVQCLGYCMVHFQLERCGSCDDEKDGFISQLRRTGVILTNKGLRRLGECSVHFGVELGNPVNVWEMLEGTGVEWIEVDQCYLEFASSASSCRGFLTELGVTDFVNLISAGELPYSDSALLELREILMAVSGKQGSPERCGLLLGALDKLWDGHYENSSKLSSLVLMLQRFTWVEGSDGELHQPGKLFHRTTSVEEILGSSACYVKTQIQSAGLVRALGLKTEVHNRDIQAFFEYLSSVRQASLTQMEKVYKFMSDNEHPENCFHYLASPRFFIPLAITKKRSKQVLGDLHRKLDVTWSEPFRFEECVPGLGVRTMFKFYPSLREFFIDTVGVREAPDFFGYVNLLERAAALCSPSVILDKVLELFASWSQEIESGKLESDELQRRKDAVASKNIFPTMQDTWTSISSSPEAIVCWCDNMNLADEFEEDDLKSITRFVNVGEDSAKLHKKRTGFVVSFLKFLGLAQFSEIVERQVVAYGTSKDLNLENTLHRMISYAQRYMIQFHPETYESLSKGDVPSRLSGLQCLVADKLFYCHTLSTGRVSSKNRTECNSLIQGNILYVSSSHSKDYSTIYLELSRLLFGGKPNTHLANFLHLITLQASANPDEDLEAIVSASQGLQPLSAQHSEWKAQPGDFKPITSSSINPLSAEVILERQRSKASHSGKNAQEQKLKKPKTSSEFQCREVQIDKNSQGVFLQRDHIKMQAPVNPEQLEITGRLGEEYVYKYLCKKFCNEAHVEWVNKVRESGSPFDIIVERGNGAEQEYVEVKATRSIDKNWFEVSVPEWEFAREKEERYTIIRIVLLPNQQQGRISQLKNPVKLCRDKVLQLAILEPPR